MNVFFEISGLNVYIQIIMTLIMITLELSSSRRKGKNTSIIDAATTNVIGLAGWFLVTSGIFGHIIYANEVAASIGWPLNSGFQMELAFASIGIGLVGGIGFWNRSFWLPFIISNTLFMWGAGYTHILHMVQHNNFSPSNTGIVVYWDFLLPILMIVLYLLYQREQKASS